MTLETVTLATPERRATSLIVGFFSFVILPVAIPVAVDYASAGADYTPSQWNRCQDTSSCPDSSAIARMIHSPLDLEPQAQ